MSSGIVNPVLDLILKDEAPQVIDIVEYLSIHLIPLRRRLLFGDFLVLSNVVNVLLVMDYLRARSFALRRSNLLSGGVGADVT